MKIRGTDGRATLVNPELHRPETARRPDTAPPPPDAANLALVHQELHRPPMSLQDTPGYGPGFGSNPMLEAAKARGVRSGASDGVDVTV